MEIGPEPLDERVGRFRYGLKASGVKLTHQRLDVSREVAKSADHPDVETVFRGVRRRVPSISGCCPASATPGSGRVSTPTWAPIIISSAGNAE